MSKVKQIIIHSKKHGHQTALVDESDFDLVSKLKWRLEKGRHCFYAISLQPNSKQSIRMHQLILGVKPKTDGTRSKPIDHEDHNGLNNCRSNIRHATNSQNAGNSNLSKRNTTGFKGITLNKKKAIFIARIRVNRVLINLGSSKNITKAIKLYNAASVKYFGQFAKPNAI